MSTRPVLRIFLLAAALTATIDAASAQDGERRSLAVEEVLATLSFGIRVPIDLSPDGEWVAYTLEDARRHEPTADPRYGSYSRTGALQEASGCDIWITNVKSGESRNLSAGLGTNWGPVWSPDGQRLAFYSDRGGLARLWVWERPTGALREVSTALVRPYFGFASVRWTPDSRRVLLKVLPEGVTVEAAAEVFATGAAPPAAGHSGVTATVFEAHLDAPGAPQEPATAGDVLVSTHGRFLSDVALIDVTTGTVDRIARNTQAIGFALSPDGKSVSYTTHVGHYPHTQDQHYDLVVVSLATRQTRIVAPRVRQQYAVTMSWSPDSRTLAYTTSRSQRGHAGEAYVVTPAGGAPRRISGEGTPPDFATPYRAPLWSPRGDSLFVPIRDSVWQLAADGSGMRRVSQVPGRDIVDLIAVGNNVGRVWSPDGGRSLVAVTRDHDSKRQGFFRIDLLSGRAVPLREEEAYYGSTFSFTNDVSDDGRTIVYVSEGARQPPDIWVTDPTFHTPRRVTRINPHLDRIALGEGRLLSWTSAIGTPLKGALLLPSDYQAGTRYPLIVKLYAGSFLSDSVYRFGGPGSGNVDNLHLLTSRGYAVLLPDVPVRVGTPMTDIPGAVLPGVDHAIALGIADPDRLGITGHSYGGYSTLAMITQSPRFKAAVDSAGTSNLVSTYGVLYSGAGSEGGTIGWTETGQGRMGGTLWEQRQRFLDNSPIFFLDRVQTPLLLVHGGLDRTVLPAQAEEVFVGLRRLGKPVAYARYEGEDHWQGTWGRANVIDYWTRVIAWFDRYLKTPAQQR